MLVRKRELTQDALRGAGKSILCHLAGRGPESHDAKRSSAPAKTGRGRPRPKRIETTRLRV
ncbi:protein of unknown function [Agreia sp. COWG]|nr:protein of unknown function [Agreia sp. COWG]